MEKKIEKNSLKSHRERVDDMNKFLDSLSDVRILCWMWLICSIMICLRLALVKLCGNILMFSVITKGVEELAWRFKFLNINVQKST